MKKILILSLLSFVLCLKSGVFAQDVSGPIGVDTTWTAANSPYIVKGDIMVGENVVLTIQPGVTVKFDTSTSLIVDGRLVARGTSGSIIFTSSKEQPVSGDWGGISFTGNAMDATYDSAGNYRNGSILENVVVEYGGSGWVTALIEIVNAKPFINNVIVQRSAQAGIRIEGEKPKIRNSTISNNGSHGIYVDGWGDYVDIQGCTISNNAYAGIYVNEANGLIHNNTVSNNSGAGITISGSSNGNVTISKNIIKQNSMLGLYVYANSGGSYTIEKNFILSNIGGGVSAYGGYLRNNIIADNQSTSISANWIAPDVEGNVIVNNVSDDRTICLQYQGYYEKVFNKNLIVSNVVKGLYAMGIVYLSKYDPGYNYYGGNPVINNNNFINNTAQYVLENGIYSPSSPINAGSNWWGASDDSTIQSSIYDYDDNNYLSIVDYDYTPHLTSPSAEAPISPPTGVILPPQIQIVGQMIMTWNPNPEGDVAGYKIYWDDDGFPFDSVVDVGSDTSYTIYTTANVYVAVTAYDTGYVLANDDTATIVNENQTNGHESWYSRLNRLPSVSLLASPSSGNVPLYVYLMATAQDSDGNIVSYSWDFDGDATFETTTTSNSISYTYETAGTYPATVKVTDNSGGQASVFMNVVCSNPVHANRPPVIRSIGSVGGVWMISPGDGVELFINADDPDAGDSVSFEWSCATGGTFVYPPGTTSSYCTWVAPMDTTVLSHQLFCRVTDLMDAYVEDYVLIHINRGGNQPPGDFYVYASKYRVNRGEQISLSASARDPDYDTLYFDWTQTTDDITNPLGTFHINERVDTSSATWTAPIISTTYPVCYTLKCSVNDGNGHIVWQSIPVDVLPQSGTIPPTVNLTFSPNSVNVGTTVYFWAEASDADGPITKPITKYEWDLDGNNNYETTTTGCRITYTYNTARVYNPKVRVTDNDGLTAVGSTMINVLGQNTPPTVTLTADTTYGIAPLTVHFEATAYDSDGIRNYGWDFNGDSNCETTTTWNSISHAFDSGTYYVNVVVTDNRGMPATGSIVITARAPDAANSWPVITRIYSDMITTSPGGRVRLSAVAYDYNNDPLTYEWELPAGYLMNFSEDGSSCDWVAPHESSGPPSYELWCEVTDGKGGSDRRSIRINMDYRSNYNNSPWVTITPSKYQANFNETITLSATASDPDDDPLTYEWSANNGTFNYTTAAVVNWTAPNYQTGVNIKVFVKDGRGGDAWAEVFINVYSTLPPPPTVNQPPIITDVHPDVNTIDPNGTNNKVRLFASAYDPDCYDSVSYNWRSASGAGYFTNPGPNSASCDWYAPSSLSWPPSYELICEVRDTRGCLVQKSIWIYMNYGVGSNKPPTGLTIISSKTYGVKANEEIYLYGFAYDPDGDPLTYTWRQEFTDTAYVRLGTFTDTTCLSPRWKAPLIRAWQVGNKPQVFFFIECKVSDGRGGFVEKRISVEVLTASNEPVIIATPVSGNAPLTVDFTVDADTTNIVKYEWDFDGNGTFDKTDTTTNTARNIYMKEGIYGAKVRVQHRSGGLVTSQPVTITVSAGPVMGNIDTSSPGSALRVDGFDLYALSIVFGLDAQSQNWNKLADLDDSGVIDGNDLVILAVNFGRKLQ